MRRLNLCRDASGDIASFSRQYEAPGDTTRRSIATLRRLRQVRDSAVDYATPGDALRRLAEGQAACRYYATPFGRLRRLEVLRDVVSIDRDAGETMRRWLGLHLDLAQSEHRALAAWRVSGARGRGANGARSLPAWGCPRDRRASWRRSGTASSAPSRASAGLWRSTGVLPG
jgi:hypothetical protein